jgi:alpha-galactosidase
MKTPACLMIGLCLALPAHAQKFEELVPTPPMGWNTWNAFGVHCSESLVEETARAMIATGMRDAGYVYVVVDDAWLAPRRDAAGDVTADPAKFPHGMKALGDFLHANGFKFGLYNCAGSLTCAGFPGGQGHEYQDARTYASWGVDFLKYDWCNCGTANAPETYRIMSRAIRAAGRPMVFSLCEWGESSPWLWAAPVGHLWRTTEDIYPSFERVKAILDLQAGLGEYAGPGHWNDPDMLEVGNGGLTIAESRAHFSLWCVLAAPLIAGNDVRSMTPEVRAILTNRDVIAVDQDPLGREGFRYRSDPGREIWVKPLSNREWAVCVLNTLPRSADLSVDWAGLTFLTERYYHIRDLWTGKEAGRSVDAFTARVEPHGALLYRLRPGW